jgi:glutamine cyclotransferase
MKLYVFLILIYACICMRLKELITTADYSVLKNIKRQETYYTQGLINDKGYLYESGGLYGQSVLIKMEYPSLKEVTKILLEQQYFGEGIGVCKDKLYQLTWQERKILYYTYPEIKFIDILPMDQNVKSGWGLANFNENSLIATDGSENIYTLDCNNDLKVIGTMPVTLNGNKVDRLNALAFAKGRIYGNRYYDTQIYRIDPKTGIVDKVYEMKNLVDMEKEIGTLTDSRLSSGDVLNGITYIPDRDVFILTGKKWNNYYEVIFK